MTKPCKVSVVIPCFNHGEFLPEAVCSATCIERDDIELIVVDDGSTDERTRKEMDALPAQGIKVIRQENKGLAAARNAGIAISRGEYILPLDADDRLRFGCFDRGLESWNRIHELASSMGMRNVSGLVRAAGISDRSNGIGCCDGITFTLPPSTVVLFGNRIAATMARCPFKGMKIGIFGWVLWSMAGNLRTCRKCFSTIDKPKESMFTRTREFESQIEAFVARKHGLLYRQAVAATKARARIRERDLSRYR